MVGRAVSRRAAAPGQVERIERCPVCSSLQREPLYDGLTDRVFGVSAGEWSMHRCECGAAYLDPRPTRDALAAAYQTYYTHTPPTAETAPKGLAATSRRALRNGLVNARYGYQLTPAIRPAPMLLALAPGVRGSALRAFRHLPAGGRLLDVGCGSGGFVAHARSVGWEAIGIDVDQAAIDVGRSAGYDLRCETLAEHDNVIYDAITLSHVIEHVTDPVGLLREARQRLAPDGMLWIATPNLGSLGHRRYHDRWFAFDVPRHLVLFEHRSLRLALQKAGFGTVRDAPHTDAAAAYFAASESMRDGGLAVDAVPSWAMRLRGWLADRRAGRDPRLGEELVVLAEHRAGNGSQVEHSV